MEYITVENGERNFTIAKKIIGTKDRYILVASCRNRGQAENLVKLLNAQSSKQN